MTDIDPTGDAENLDQTENDENENNDETGGLGEGEQLGSLAQRVGSDQTVVWISSG